MRVHAILNPALPGYERSRAALVAGVRSAGWPEVVVGLTTREEPGRRQAEQALAAGAELIVAGGGDGTVREVAGAVAGSDVPLGLLPYGTANLFARNMGLRPRRSDAVVRAALHGRRRRVDVGTASCLTANGVREETFLVLAGLGYDAATVLATRAEFKWRLGWLAYLHAGTRYLVRRPAAMTVAADGAEPRRVRSWCVLAGNCGRIPGGIRVFPAAKPDDGLLDTLEVPLTSPLQWTQVAAKGLLRLRRDVPALTYGRASTLTVRPDAPQPVQVDGDVVDGVAELRVGLRPGALLVQTPAPRSSPPRH